MSTLLRLFTDMFMFLKLSVSLCRPSLGQYIWLCFLSCLCHQMSISVFLYIPKLQIRISYSSMVKLIASFHA